MAGFKRTHPAAIACGFRRFPSSSESGVAWVDSWDGSIKSEGLQPSSFLLLVAVASNLIAKGT